MARSKITFLAMGLTIITLFVMLYPRRYFAGIDLGSPELEAAVFSISMLSWIVARAGRWRSDTYFVFRSNVWDAEAGTVRHNISVSIVEFVILAAALQSFKLFLPHRTAQIARFALDATVMVAVGLLCYGMILLLLRSRRGRRFVAKLR